MTKTPTLLKFKLTAKIPPKIWLEGANKLNKTAWMGKDPETCKIVDFKQRQGVTINRDAVFDIVVEHRPQGCITLDGSGYIQDSWKVKHIDVSTDGKTLLDGKGKPLPPGEDPVYCGPWRFFNATDFNKFDFGELIGEEELDSSARL